MNPQLRDDITRLHAGICKGLADPNRILILYTLAEQPHAVGDLALRVDLPQPTVSRHLKILRERGMVAAARHGQAVVYQLGDDRIIAALNLLQAFMADRLRDQAALVGAVQ